MLASRINPRRWPRILLTASRPPMLALHRALTFLAPSQNSSSLPIRVSAPVILVARPRRVLRSTPLEIYAADSISYWSTAKPTSARSIFEVEVPAIVTSLRTHSFARTHWLGRFRERRTSHVLSPFSLEIGKSSFVASACD